MPPAGESHAAADFDWLEGATGVRLRVYACATAQIVRVAGEIDSASSDAIESALGQALRSARHVELDLTRVSFISPAGDAMIARARARAEQLHVGLHVAAARLSEAHRHCLPPRQHLKLALTSCAAQPRTPWSDRRGVPDRPARSTGPDRHQRR